MSFELDPASFQAPPPPAPRRSDLRFASWMAEGFGGFTSMAPRTGPRPTSTSQSTPGLARVSLPLTLWHEMPGRPRPCSGPGEGKLAIRVPGCERECLAFLFHPALAES